MRAIVLGAGGQLGVELTEELRRRGHSVMPVERKQLDIAAPEAVEAMIARYRPDWTLNAAAYNQVDQAEADFEAAMRINGFGVRHIAAACQRNGSTLLHYSTDHVFDGESTEPYTEDDLPAPPSAYGISKLAGEHFARVGCERTFVVRVAGVFGPAGRYTTRGNFPELVLRKAAARETLRVVEDFFATPTYALPLAARSIDLLQGAPFGLYHIGGAETISWFEYARRIARAAGFDADIRPTNRLEFVTPARRPRHASLANRKIEALGFPPMPSLDEALADYLKRRESPRPEWF